MKRGIAPAITLFIAITALFIVLSTALSFSLMNGYISDVKSQPVINSFRIIINPVLDCIKENYIKISDYETFYEILEPELKKINATLRIINLNSFVVYDSQKKIPPKKLLKENLEYTLLNYSGNKNKKMIKMTFPVVINDTQVANAIFFLPADKFYNGSHKILPFIPMILGGGFICFTLIIFYFYINKNVSKPVRLLNNAVPEIIRGNYDREIEYLEDNEIGSFIRAFDLMRLELMDTQLKKDKLERDRKELISSVSHDLKTPLSSIKAYSEGIADGIADNPDTILKYASVINKKADSLIKLVNDLLQHSLQDLGTLQINLKEEYSRKLIIDIIEPLRIKLADSATSLEIENDIPDVLIRADALRLEQVFVNLVQNAEKYVGNNGRIIINIVQEDNCLLFSVRDNGRGIPPEDLPYIFDRYYRGTDSKTSKIEGTGLGLSICKYIIERHGGVIFAESIANKGSVFHFTIPKI